MKTLAFAIALATVAVVARPAFSADLVDTLLGRDPQLNYDGAIAKGDWVWKEGAYDSSRGDAADYMRLQPTETATSNAQPKTISVEQLSTLLAAVRVKAAGKVVPLFGAAESKRLAAPFSEAFRRADPRKDVVFFSSDRREAGFLAPRLGVAGMAFLSDDAVNLIIGAARLDFFDQYRAAGVMPAFTHGSRAKQAPTELSAEGARYPAGDARHDWLALPLAQAQATKPAEQPAQRASPAPEHAAPLERDERFYDLQEQRLRRLQRLREQGLITDQEFQEKKKEILRDL